MMKKINKVNIGPNFVVSAVNCRNDYEKKQGPHTNKHINLNNKKKRE